MQLVVGNLWDELGRADLLLVTTNGCIDQRGCLVMGAGAARQAKQRFSNLPWVLGNQASARSWVDDDGPVVYGLLPGSPRNSTWIGAFQTKLHWRDPSPVELIALSTTMLALLADRHERIALNYPGVGRGTLHTRQVAPLLEALPDNVYVYRKDF